MCEKAIIAKRLQLILFNLVLGVGLVIGHTAQGEVKLTVHDLVTPRHLSSDISGNTIIVGGPVFQPPRDDHAKIYVGNARNWREEAKIAPIAGRNYFGWSVSISRNTVIVGAPNEDVVGENSGSAYIFAGNGNKWEEQAKLVAAAPAARDLFGDAVSIDGATLVVGAPEDDDAGKDAGSAHVFVRAETSWRLQALLIPSDLGGSDSFGGAVSLRGDIVVIGAPGHTHSGAGFAGAAYVFVREAEKWAQQAKLTADDAGAFDSFGRAVAISGDTIIVGAPSDDTQRGKDAGAAYVFTREGNKWQQQAKLVPKDTRRAQLFGSSVATAGSIAIIGGPGYDSPEKGSGAAYSFVRVDGLWKERRRVVPKEGTRALHFGFSVAMSRNTVVVSAHNSPLHNERAHGTGAAAYVYDRGDFGTPPFALEPSGLNVTRLGQVKRTALLQNFPNPFNPETWLPYRLGAEANVMLRIYNVQGQLTCELDLGVQQAGDYLTQDTAAYWDGRDHVGETVSSGVYFYTLQAGPFQATRRMLTLK